MISCSGAHGLRAGDIGSYLTYELVKIAQALQPADDYLVIDLDVVVHQDVAETNRLAHRGSQIGREHAMRTQHPDRVTVIGWWPPAFRSTDVLGDIDTGLDGGDERVLDAAEPEGIPATLLAGLRFLPKNGGVVGDVP